MRTLFPVCHFIMCLCSYYSSFLKIKERRVSIILYSFSKCKNYSVSCSKMFLLRLFCNCCVYDGYFWFNSSCSYSAQYL